VADLQKTIKSYPESFGAKNAMLLLQQINQQSLSAEIENVNVPDEPILAKLNYKNLQKATLSIYNLTEQQLIEIKKLKDRSYYYAGEVPVNANVLVYLQKLKSVQQHVNLPDPKDYRMHAVEFKIDPLKPGFYVLLLSGENLRDSSLISLMTMRVTNLAYVSRQSAKGLEIRTINRKNGHPLQDVKIILEKESFEEMVGQKASDKNGKALFKLIENMNFQVRLSVPEDFYSSNESFYKSRYNQEVRIEEKTILFTDRQLYRPGQTIYFKGLELQINNGRSEVIKNKEAEIEFNDSNNKDLGSVKVKSNEFGTFSGSFILPQSMLNGEVTLETDDGELTIKVEEY
ncbi:MAG: hypothetical protein EOP43_08180, partial [Sphingobacteriaceae bacterium]